jgi:hypothetical protein
MPISILSEKACNHQTEIAIGEEFPWLSDERI